MSLANLGDLLDIGDRASVNEKTVDLGSHGELILNAIKSPDFNSNLWGLVLINCSIPQNVWSELFQILHSCTHLQQLVCINNRIGHVGRFIVEPLDKWIYLDCYVSTIPQYQNIGQIIQSLSNCKHLTHLVLSGNKVGNAGEYVAKTIQQWGMDPPLQSLYLANCSIPEEHCSTILQSLHSCIHLTELSKTGNDIGTARQFLAEFFNQWGCNPPLQNLLIRKCSLEEIVYGEIIKSLGTCKNLKAIDLFYNTVGESACMSASTINTTRGR